jgi:hypothetical protein
MPASGRGPDPTAVVAAVAAKKASLESGDDSEEESEILEESPCGRWLKRREVVSGLNLFIQTAPVIYGGSSNRENVFFWKI